MADLATLLARRESLLAAKYAGTARVTYEGRTIEYRSLEDIDRVIADLDAAIAAETAQTTPGPRLRQIRIQMTKGV